MRGPAGALLAAPETGAPGNARATADLHGPTEERNKYVDTPIAAEAYAGAAVRPLGALHRALWCRRVSRAATVALAAWQAALAAAVVASAAGVAHLWIWWLAAALTLAVAVPVTLVAQRDGHAGPGECRHRPTPAARLAERLDRALA